MLRGMIFEVQHLALYDGPGLRTVLYCKGCPLRCLWCHNPEGQTAREELLYHEEKCTRCGLCASVCPSGAQQIADGTHTFLRRQCAQCGRCAALCPSGAMVACGREVSVEEALGEVLGDRAFFRGEGGLTLSGGEPLMQAEFSSALLHRAREEGIHTCVETCGHAPAQAMRDAVEATDLFLFDIKELDSRKHREMTGVGNEQILANLQLLEELGKRVILRCPIIPEQNLRQEHFLGIARLAQRLSCVEAVELEPYHPLGLSKWASLGRKAPYARREFLDAATLGGHAAAMRAVTEKPVRLSSGEPL